MAKKMTIVFTFTKKRNQQINPQNHTTQNLSSSTQSTCGVHDDDDDAKRNRGLGTNEDDEVCH